jgi:hypothetical protein
MPDEAYAPKLCVSCEDMEDDEVVLESYQVTSSPSQPSRQAVRESNCLDSLSGRDVALMLTGMPPVEAARLALSMEDEERILALAYMNSQDRDAVIGAMPYESAVAAGLIDPDYDGEEMVEVTEDYEGSGRQLPPGRRASWLRSLGDRSPSGGASPSSFRIGNIKDKAVGATSSLRDGLSQAAGRARASEMPSKAVGAASTAAGSARKSFLQAAEKAKVSERAMGAMGAAGSAARRAREAAVAAAPSSTEQAKEKAKEKAAVAKETATVAAGMAAHTASAALSSASKGIASMWSKKRSNKTPDVPVGGDAI